MDYIADRSQLSIFLIFYALLGNHVSAFFSIVGLSRVDPYKRCSAAWLQEHSLCASHAFIAGRKDERLENRAVLVHLYSGYFHTLTKVAFLKASSQNNFTLLMVEVVLVQVNLSK